MTTSNTPSPSSIDAQLPTAETGLTPDELFDIVTTRRRRRVLVTLRRQGGSAALESLTSSLETDEEARTEPPTATLHHLVLPKLEQANLVTRDGDDVVLTDGGASVAAWLELVAAC